MQLKLGSGEKENGTPHFRGIAATLESWILGTAEEDCLRQLHNTFLSAEVLANAYTPLTALQHPSDGLSTAPVA